MSQRNVRSPVALLLLLALFGVQLVSGAEANGRYVTVTLDGRHRIRGQTEHSVYENRPFVSFKGVPYAEAPVGRLRFKPPVPKHLPYHLDALDHGSICAQYVNQVFVGSEDCLFLNVFTPAIIPNRQLAVIVFFPGGGFHRGGIDRGFAGPDFMVEHDVILVTVNYRLNALGLMSLGTAEFAGNMALKDQQLALQWVQRHIRQFGGDPQRVTLLGASAGSASVHLQMLEASSKGLFKRAIMMGGSVGNFWAVSSYVDHRQLMLDIARSHNASIESYADLVDWLQWAPATSLVYSSISQPPNTNPLLLNTALPWAPVVANGTNERFVVQGDPWANLGYQTDMDVMIGYNSHEEVATYGPWFENAANFAALDNNFNVPVPFRGWDECRNPTAYAEVQRAIRQFYFGDAVIDVDTFPQLIAMLSDMQYTYGIDRSVRHQLAHSTGKTFYYRFSANTTLNIFKRLSGTTPLLLASHTDELCYFFKCLVVSNLYDNLRPESIERQIQRDLLSMWTDFAKFGHPTPQGTPLDFAPATADNYQVVDISNDGVAHAGNPNWQANDFWDALHARHSSDFESAC